MSYSKDFREQVLAHIDLGSTINEVSKLFSIGTSSIKRWKRNRRDTGEVMGSGRPTGAYKIDEAKLIKFIDENPDAILDEIATHFNVTAPGILKALKRLNITRKKSPHSTKKGAR
jgi:transposase